MMCRSSSFLMRSKIADGAMPNRRAISALAMRASRCRKPMICRSVSSRERPTLVTGTSRVSREWLMTEHISAPGPVIKTNRHPLRIHDEHSSSISPSFKQGPSLRHPTPRMLTDLAEPETTIVAMPSPPPPLPVDRDAEQALVARAQRGDVAAFETLYRANAPRVFALSLRLTGHRT